MVMGYSTHTCFPACRKALGGRGRTESREQDGGGHTQPENMPEKRGKECVKIPLGLRTWKLVLISVWFMIPAQTSLAVFRAFSKSVWDSNGKLLAFQSANKFSNKTIHHDPSPSHNSLRALQNSFSQHSCTAKRDNTCCSITHNPSGAVYQWNMTMSLTHSLEQNKRNPNFSPGRHSHNVCVCVCVRVCVGVRFLSTVIMRAITHVLPNSREEQLEEKEIRYTDCLSEVRRQGGRMSEKDSFQDPGTHLHFSVVDKLHTIQYATL